MSEYQYYEFRAVDRPPGRTEQRELRAISTRAQITAAGFVDHYEWCDLKGRSRSVDVAIFRPVPASCKLGFTPAFDPSA